MIVYIFQANDAYVVPIKYWQETDSNLVGQLGLENIASDSNKFVNQDKLNSAIIYLSCFRSIIKRRHKESLEQDVNFYFKEQHIKEKSILRKIAALKEIYGDSLTYDIAHEKIKKFGSDFKSDDLSEDFDNIFGGMVSSYFYYRSGGRSEKRIEFMHKSFREFFLAEYIIESIIANKPHRLNLVASSDFDGILF